jgi:hypothetical protein
MDFLEGGIEDASRRGFWETTFRRAAEDEFDVEYTPDRDTKKVGKYFIARGHRPVPVAY